jgi:hypothetical protein
MPPGRGVRRTPFAERGGRLRGLLDLSTGRYPAFLFGGSIGATELPVFHLHESTRDSLEPLLRYLAENNYRTVTSDAIASLVRDGVHPGSRSVALCFDDAWASLWTVAAPLLRRYSFRAITFAIPARIADAPASRATLDDGAVIEDDPSSVPFVTWPELRALHASGLIDVQSHSWTHSMVFSDAAPLTFVTPAFIEEPLLNRPRCAAGEVRGASELTLRFLTPDDLGAPLYPRRSRLSDTWRHHEDETVRERCTSYVRDHGGPAFFSRPGWRHELIRVHGPARERFEPDESRERSILEELDRSRSELNMRLGTTTVKHLCAPWGIAGAITRELAGRVGYETLFADRLFGRRTVKRGDDPYSLMRLHERFIWCLPGRGRRYFHTAA